jgi:hypothetical protein
VGFFHLLALLLGLAAVRGALGFLLGQALLVLVVPLATALGLVGAVLLVGLLGVFEGALVLLRLRQGVAAGAGRAGRDGATGGRSRRLALGLLGLRLLIVAVAQLVDHAANQTPDGATQHRADARPGIE